MDKDITIPHSHSLLFQQNEMGVYLRKKDGEFVEFNQRFIDYINNEDGSLVGLNFGDFIGKDEIQNTNTLLAKSENKSCMRDVTVQRKDGSEYHFQIAVLEVEINDEAYVLGMVKKLTRFSEESHEYLERFAENLKKLRLKNEVTQFALAKSIGISQRHIQRLEAADTNPTLEVLIRVSNFFKVPVENLFE